MTFPSTGVNPPGPDTPSLEHTYREGGWALRAISRATTAESIDHAARAGLLLERVSR